MHDAVVVAERGDLVAVDLDDPALARCELVERAERRAPASRSPKKCAPTLTVSLSSDEAEASGLKRLASNVSSHSGGSPAIAPESMSAAAAPFVMPHFLKPGGGPQMVA